ncbi:excisionase family DNA binding protein [Streptacidiphilus sp. BW17]|uniref:helix-turn-helix domain-containing protein n=1 Tax=Streptacidiphilus sp. BW17 TaxID=3156274 RepID=UPI0035189573
MSTSLSLIARALGVTEHQLAAAIQEHSAPVPDATLVALTVEEAARRLGIGRTTMYALIASGEVQSVQIGRLRRIPADALDAYIVSRSQAVTPAALAA